MIQALALSPDGRWLASGGYDKTIVVWNAATGEEQRKLIGNSAITQIAFSPDGTRLASAAENGGLRIWDYQKGAAVYSLHLHGLIRHLTYSGDGKLWAASVDSAKEGSTARIEIHDAAVGTVFRIISTDWSGVSAMAITPDGLLIASGGVDENEEAGGTVRVWSVASGQPVKSYPGSAVAFSLDGRSMARLDFSKQLKVVVSDLASGLDKQTFLVRNPGSVSFSPDGTQVAITDSAAPELNLYSIATGTEIKRMSGDNSIGSIGLTTAVFSADGKLLVAAPYPGYSVKGWDVVTGRELQTFYGQGMVQGIAVSPDGHWVVAGSQQGASVWDIASARKIATLSTGPVNDLVFSRDSRWLAVNSGVQFPGETLKVWDMKSRALAADFTFGKGGTPVSAIAFASKGSPLTNLGPFFRPWEFTAADGTHTVWSASSPLAISADGKLLAARSGVTGNVDVWDMSSGRKLATLAAHKLSISVMAFSNDGRWLLTTGQETANYAAANRGTEWGTRVWDVSTWKPRISVSFSRIGAPGAAFSPDGHQLAIEKSWETIELLDLDHDVSLGKFTAVDTQPENHQFSPGNLAFTADGALLLQGAQNGIRVWKLPRP